MVAAPFVSFNWDILLWELIPSVLKVVLQKYKLCKLRNRLPRAAGDYTPLEVFKAGRCSEQPGLVEGVPVHRDDLKIMVFQVLSNPNLSMIL